MVKKIFLYLWLLSNYFMPSIGLADRVTSGHYFYNSNQVDNAEDPRRRRHKKQSASKPAAIRKSNAAPRYKNLNEEIAKSKIAEKSDFPPAPEVQVHKKPKEDIVARVHLLPDPNSAPKPDLNPLQAQHVHHNTNKAAPKPFLKYKRLEDREGEVKNMNKAVDDGVDDDDIEESSFLKDKRRYSHKHSKLKDKKSQNLTSVRAEASKIAGRRL